MYIFGDIAFVYCVFPNYDIKIKIAVLRKVPLVLVADKKYAVLCYSRDISTNGIMKYKSASLGFLLDLTINLVPNGNRCSNFRSALTGSYCAGKDDNSRNTL